MKVKKSVLVSFLKKCRMEGTQQINEAVLRFESDGLKISANSEPGQVRVVGWLQKAGFKEYEQLGNIGINDLTNVVKVLDRFGDEFNIKKEGNLLTIKGDKKKVDIELISEDFLATETGDPNLEFDETFLTTATRLKDIFKDVKMNDDAVMTFTTAEKKVAVTNTGKYKFHNEIDAPTCKGGTHVSFGEPLIEATNVLDGNIEISLKTDNPMRIKEKTDVSVVTMIIGPRVDDDE